MADPVILGISGNLAKPSRTLGLVSETVERIAQKAGGVGRVVDLSELYGLGDLRHRAGATPDVAAAFEAVESADLIVAGTPVYKGAYTGLFKHFVDFIDYRALAGVPVALLATGGSDRHSLVVEYQLRPLFAFFQAHALPTGVFVSEKDLADGVISDPRLGERYAQLIDEAVDALAARSVKEQAREAAE